MILAGDIGGTKVHLALASAEEPGRVARDAVLETASLDAPLTAIAEFAAASPRPLRGAVIGVAGPVLDDRVEGTNLPWTIDAAELSAALRVPTHLVNDLAASAHGLDALSVNELATLQPGTPRHHAPRVLVAPGTGLGESALVRSGEGWIATAGEGGHADFAPRTSEQVELFEHLRGRWGRVSWERVVSGPGLVNVFCWLRDTRRVPDDSRIRATPGEGSAAAKIGEAAVAGSSGLCREAVRLWAECLAAEAGNQALRFVARGGVFLAGGIPAKLLDALRTDGFRHAFRDKAPHEELLADLPVHVVLAPDLALRGAARLAAARVGGGPRPG